jgi:membrane protein YdbS with pleckstrin-like domain
VTFTKRKRDDNQASVVLPVVVKVAVKEVNINGKVGRVIVAEVGSALALIVAPYYTRFRTTRFHTTSKAIDKGIIVYSRNYILSGFN